jgi:hypothetical protein
MIVVVVVAVMIMGIVARSIIMPVLASAIMLMGMCTMVVTATPTAPVAVGIKDRYIQAKNR